MDTRQRARTDPLSSKDTTMRLLRDRPPVIEPTWSQPADELWIGSVGGEFAGMIEFADGHFVATDRTGVLLDNFSGIPGAMNAVATQAARR
jgi:hypothetical protein